MTGTKKLDNCVRAMTNDGGFRLVAASLSQTVTDAVRAQEIVSPASEKLAELMVGSVLVRETTQPTRRVQIALRERSGAKLVADSLPDGLTRGIVNSSGNPGAGRRMEVTYTQINGALHKGIVEIADDTDISSAMMTYLQESEQILTTISVAADARAGAVGFVVQLLPELERAQLAVMTERLAELESLSSWAERGLPSASDLIERVFSGFEYTILADSDVRFGCNCTRERFIAGIGTLAPEEIESMIAADEPLELRCDACGKGYLIAPKELKEL